MENLQIGTMVIVSDEAKENTYSDMCWKDEKLVITHTHEDSEGMGLLYSFDSLETDSEISCSLYGYELDLA